VGTEATIRLERGRQSAGCLPDFKMIQIIKITPETGIDMDRTRLLCLYVGYDNYYFGIIVSTWGIAVLLIFSKIIISRLP
jgi:hypothetical protein